MNPGIPITAQTAPLPDDIPCSRLDTPDGILLTLRLQENTTNTAHWIAAISDDAILAAICAPWGITIPVDQIRKDPVAALGPLANLLVTPGIIPQQIARHRA